MILMLPAIGVGTHVLQHGHPLIVNLLNHEPDRSRFITVID